MKSGEYVLAVVGGNVWRDCESAKSFGCGTLHLFVSHQKLRQRKPPLKFTIHSVSSDQLQAPVKCYKRPFGGSE